MPRGVYNRDKSSVFKAAEDVEDPILDAPEPVVPDEVERHPIDSAPKNGSTIRLYSQEITHGVQARWRVTRRIEQTTKPWKNRWREDAYWACPLTHKPLNNVKWTEWSW